MRATRMEMKSRKREIRVKGWINVELIIFFFSVVFDFIFLSLPFVRFHFFFCFVHFPTLFELVEKRFYFYYCRSIICRQCINIIPIVSISSIYLRRVVCPYAIFPSSFSSSFVPSLLVSFAFSLLILVLLCAPSPHFWLYVDLIHCHSKRYYTPVASLLQYPLHRFYV